MDVGEAVTLQFLKQFEEVVFGDLGVVPCLEGLLFGGGYVFRSIIFFGGHRSLVISVSPRIEQMGKMFLLKLVRVETESFGKW